MGLTGERCDTQPWYRRPNVPVLHTPCHALLTPPSPVSETGSPSLSSPREGPTNLSDPGTLRRHGVTPG